MCLMGAFRSGRNGEFFGCWGCARLCCETDVCSRCRYGMDETITEGYQKDLWDEA